MTAMTKVMATGNSADTSFGAKYATEFGPATVKVSITIHQMVKALVRAIQVLMVFLWVLMCLHLQFHLHHMKQTVMM